MANGIAAAPSRHDLVEDLSGVTPVLRAFELHKSFGRFEILKGISLAARQGDVISILGSSGSSKSTLLRCLNFLEQPTSGEIWFGDHRIEIGERHVPQREVNALRRLLGMVFQSFNLWQHMTVLQNIIEAPVHVLGLPKQDAIYRAETLLAKVGLSEKRQAYPSELSGGQQQRVAIARTLAMEPQILLFDEPTSALDPERVGDVLAVIRNLAAEGRTMLIVTHELGFARKVSNRILFLHKGMIEEEGTPDQIFSEPASPHLRQFLASQSRSVLP